MNHINNIIIIKIKLQQSTRFNANRRRTTIMIASTLLQLAFVQLLLWQSQLSSKRVTGVYGQVTDPSTVQVGDAVWYVPLFSYIGYSCLSSGPKNSHQVFSTLALAAIKHFSFEGFVMDYYCIDRGTLLDNPSVVTLEGPDQHSVHWCVQSEQLISYFG